MASGQMEMIREEGGEGGGHASSEIIDVKIKSGVGGQWDVGG